jgi:ABC-type transport system substrate-binding protein
MSWLFHLRRGVEFHDGTRFDATAVKFHFDRILDPVTKSTRLTRVAQLAGTDVVDEYTIRFRMKTPYSVWPEVLRDPFACIVSPAAARAAGDSRNFTNHPVGTGPFRFAEYIPDRYVLLRRNPSYWGGDVIKFEELMFKPVREPTTRLILLEQGQLDLADVSWAHTEVAERSGRIRIDKVPWLAIRYIGLNNQKPPFNDARVRRAANFAINRDDIVKYAFRGNCDPALGPLPPVLPVFNREMETFHYDPDRARALLREADYPKGYQAVMWAIDSLSDKAVAEIVQEQLRMAGIDVKVLQFDRAVYWDKFDAFITADGKWFPTGEGVFDMFIGGWVGGENAHGYLDPLFRSTSNSNNAFYRNDEVDRLLDESLKTTDPAGRDDIYRRLQAMIVADAPWIFAYHSRILMGMSPRVRGWHTNPSGEYELQNVFIDGQAKA